MSESPNEPDQSANQSTGEPAEPVISDEQLPEDLQPEKNPLARDPDDPADDPADDPGDDPAHHTGDDSGGSDQAG